MKVDMTIADYDEDTEVRFDFDSDTYLKMSTKKREEFWKNSGRRSRRVR